MEINIINQSGEARWTKYKKDFLQIAENCENILKLQELHSASVIFVTAEDIHKINREYRNIDRPTDVISFALRDSEENYEVMDGEDELGDIFINIEAIQAQAKEYGHSLRREVCFLFTHGLLHLLGYDHMEKEDEVVMFTLQDKILNNVVPKKIHS